eukprot:g641.t1
MYPRRYKDPEKIAMFINFIWRKDIFHGFIIRFECLHNKDYDLTLASIMDSDIARFLDHEYQPRIFLDKEYIVICGVLYCLWGGQSERINPKQY